MQTPIYVYIYGEWNSLACASVKFRVNQSACPSVKFRGDQSACPSVKFRVNQVACPSVQIGVNQSASVISRWFQNAGNAAKWSGYLFAIFIQHKLPFSLPSAQPLPKRYPA